MNLPATIRVSTVPHGTAVPPGYTVSGQRVPPGTYHQPGAGAAHYEKPRVTSVEKVKPHVASRYRQYFNKHGLGPARNTGRVMESNFPSYSGNRNDPLTDVARNTEGIRNRRPIQQESSSNPGSSTIRNYGGTTGGNAGGATSIPIESFEISESVPLLATPSATSLTTGAIATGVGLSAAGLTLGAVTNKAINSIKTHGAVLPGTEYVGPGNPINIDAPRSEVDAIAKEHDVGYQDFQDRAERGELTEQEFVEGIDFLDNKAIQQFADRFHTGGEWQAFLGRWGLWLKNRVERVTGPIYPKFPGKQWAVGRIFRRIRDLLGLV